MATESLSDPVPLAEHAAEICRLGKRVVADIIEIGRRLTKCKRICGHGNFLPWLDREFGWSGTPPSVSFRSPRSRSNSASCGI